MEIHLRGKPVAGFHEWLAEQTSARWRDRIFIHDLVSNEELLSRIAEHDIGFAGEMKYCRNRDLTVTNKLLYYLLAGLAVVASDTVGQQEIASQAPEAILLYRSGNASDLAERINTLLEYPEILEHAKRDALRAAEQRFCWEHQEPMLLSAIGQMLGVSAARGAS